jgi:hypothetical protein
MINLNSSLLLIKIENKSLRIIFDRKFYSTLNNNKNNVNIIIQLRNLKIIPCYSKDNYN